MVDTTVEYMWNISSMSVSVLVINEYNLSFHCFVFDSVKSNM